MRNTKVKDLIPFLPVALVLFLALLLSWPKFSLATLTVSNTGLQGDANITLDTNGTLGVGTASATTITIGQAALNVSIPGSLTVSSATTTVNNLHVIGACLGCGISSGGIAAINGLTNATTSLVAGTNITIATSSPNVITISAGGGSGSTTPGGFNTQLQFNNSEAFGASANLSWLSPALTIGQTGTTTGQLKLAGVTSGIVTVQASSTAGTWTLTLPPSAGTSGYVLSTDGSGNTSWIAQSGGSSVAIDGLSNSTFNFTASGTGLSLATTSPGTIAYTWTNPGFITSAITAINGLSNATTSLVAGTNITIATSSPNVITISASGGSGSTTPGGSNTQLQFNSSGIFGASPNLTWLSPALTIGQTGTTTGQLKLAGGTSGTDTIQASSTAGTWTMTLPTSAGTAGYVLSTDGSGNTSWIAQSGGSQWTATSTGIYFGGNVGIGSTLPSGAPTGSMALGGTLYLPTIAFPGTTNQDPATIHQVDGSFLSILDPTIEIGHNVWDGAIATSGVPASWLGMEANYATASLTGSQHNYSEVYFSFADANGKVIRPIAFSGDNGNIDNYLSGSLFVSPTGGFSINRTSDQTSLYQFGGSGILTIGPSGNAIVFTHTSPYIQSTAGQALTFLTNGQYAAFSASCNGLTFGSGQDTNLCRPSAGVLQTNGSFLVAGNVGIGTSTPATTLQVSGGTNPTILIGGGSIPGCLELGNSNGTSGINYITALNGSLTATTTKPSSCQ